MNSPRRAGANRALRAGPGTRTESNSETIDALLWRASGAGERRSPDPLNELGRRLNSACVMANHPLEIAAALESEGISDRIAHAAYGYPDVFSLAEELFRRIPRRDLDGPPVPGGDSVRSALRSLAFLLPTGLLVGLSREVGLGSYLDVMVLALLVPWSGMQMVGYLDTRLRGRDEGAAAARVMGWGCFVLVVIVTGGGALLAADGASGATAAAIGLGHSLYFVSASVLLTRNRERRLVALVAPASVTFLGIDPPASVTFALLAGTVAAVTVTALVALRREWSPSGVPVVSRQETEAAVGHGIVGLTWAGASFLGVLTRPSPATMAVAAIPVTAMIGLAELQTVRFNERIAKLLERRIDQERFRSIVVVEVAVAVAPYVFALGFTAGLASLVAAWLGYGVDPVVVVSYNLLGVGFFGGLLITSRHHPAVALRAALPAAAVFLVAGAVEGGDISPTQYLATTAAFSLGLMATAILRGSHPLDHRAALR